MIKVYIPPVLLSLKGITEVDAEWVGDRRQVAWVQLAGGFSTLCRVGKEVFLDRESARASVELERDRKIAALEEQLKKLREWKCT